jgi:hypothetical protein
MLYCAGDLAGFEARGANLHATDEPGLDLRPNALQVWHPAALGMNHRVADVVAGLRTFGANITALGHGVDLRREKTD